MIVSDRYGPLVFRIIRTFVPVPEVRLACEGIKVGADSVVFIGQLS